MLLNELLDDDLAWLTAHGERVELSAGTVLIAEGAQRPDIHIILSGRAAVVGAPGAVFAHLLPGDVAGEISLIDGMPASATVMLTAASVILRVQRSALMDRLESGDGFAFRFHRAVARVLAGRLRGSNQRAVAGPEMDRVLSQLQAA